MQGIKTFMHYPAALCLRAALNTLIWLSQPRNTTKPPRTTKTSLAETTTLSLTNHNCKSKQRILCPLLSGGLCSTFFPFDVSAVYSRDVAFIYSIGSNYILFFCILFCKLRVGSVTRRCISSFVSRSPFRDYLLLWRAFFCLGNKDVFFYVRHLCFYISIRSPQFRVCGIGWRVCMYRVYSLFIS